VDTIPQADTTPQVLLAIHTPLVQLVPQAQLREFLDLTAADLPMPWILVSTLIAMDLHVLEAALRLAWPVTPTALELQAPLQALLKA
jgi:hypothetical protein